MKPKGHLSLPGAPGTTQRRTPVAPSRREGGGAGSPPGEPTVLIVEDNALNAELLRDILRHKGYRTAESTTAAEGLRLARELLPDLVLMDVRLPDMSGIQAVGYLRADPLLARIPVFAVTASAMTDEVETIMAAGFDGFVAKPYSLRPFLDKVAGVLEGAE